MTKSIPNVATYMTSSPHTVGADQTLAHAHVLMNDLGIRHLPVLRGGALVGMLSERDLALIEQFKDIDPRATKVEEAMSLGVYKVSPEAPLAGVAREMAAKKFGSAIVVQDHKVVGILTTVDVCSALAAVLSGQ
jgi:acetoin utilization protein AcuB